MKLFRVLFSAVVISFVPTYAFAQDPIEPVAMDTGPAYQAEALETGRGLAMGSGVRASGLSSSALAYNPGAMPFLRSYHIEGFAGYTPQLGQWHFGSMVVDSSTNKLAAGLSVRGFMSSADDSGYSGIDGRLALGFPLADAIAVGVSGRYIGLSADAQGADGEATEQSLITGFTMDSSIVVRPVDGLYIAALAYNFIDTNSELAPIQLGGSASYQIAGVFSLGGDFLVDMTTFEDPSFITGGGAEYLVAATVPIRLGYRFDSGREQHFATGGLGYVDQKMALDLSLRQQVAGGSDSQILLGFRYFVR